MCNSTYASCWAVQQYCVVYGIANSYMGGYRCYYGNWNSLQNNAQNSKHFKIALAMHNCSIRVTECNLPFPLTLLLEYISIIAFKNLFVLLTNASHIMLEKCLPALIILKIILIIMQLLPRLSNKRLSQCIKIKFLLALLLHFHL